MAGIEQLTERQRVLLVSPQLPTDEHIRAGVAALNIIDTQATELAEARAEVEQNRRHVVALSAENEKLHSGAVSALKERNDALTQLAAANALLARHFVDDSEAAWEADALAHLSTQSAAPDPRYDSSFEECPCETIEEHGAGACKLAAPEPSCAEIARLTKERDAALREELSAQGLHLVTAAQWAVLEAMATVPEAALKERAERGNGLGLGDACEAELALREAKRLAKNG